MLRNFLLTAWRSLRKNTSASFLNIFGLSAGMTAAVLIFIWVHNETSFDAYHPDAKNIYRLTTYWGSSKWTFETAPLALEMPIKSGFPDVLTVTALKTYPASLTTHLNTELLLERHCAYVDSNWFSFFHYDFVRGDAASFFRNPFSLLLTESKARVYFGDRDPIGKTIRIDTADYRVAAVVKDNPANSSFQFDMLMPVNAWLADPGHQKDDFDAGNFNYLLFLKLRPDTHPDNVAKAITSLYNSMINNKEDILSLTPLKDIHFETDLTFPDGGIEHGNRKAVDIFTILGILILIIACINYINLTTARASTRAKEVGVRKIVGAGRRSLFLQFTVETLLVSCGSVLITVFFIWLLTPFLRELTGRDYITPLKSAATWSIIGLTLLTATLLNSIYPALLMASFRPLNVLKGMTILNFRDAWLRRGLVVLQFTFSIFLIAGTIIIQRQLSYIQHLDAGYNRSQTFEFRLPWKHLGQAENIKHDLSSVSSIADLATANESIVDMQSSNSGSADWDGHDSSFKATVFKFSPDEDFGRVMGIQLREGRWFDRSRPEDEHNFILNETAINEFNIHKPVLGQRFTFQGDTGKIIGVAKDFYFTSLHEKIGPFVFFHPTHGHPTIYVTTQPGQIPAALAAARAVWKRNITDAPFDYKFLDEEFNNLYKADAKVSTLILLFSVIAILISCLGLIGLAAFTAQRRTREIGIRKVLGATMSNIITLLSWEFMRLVLFSVLIATPIAWWAANLWLRDFAYHIPLGGWTFALAGAIAIGIALLTVSSQSVKAASANPAKNLRTD
jgi:putative ABC transport system permease protein